jgi:hypothetical protein
MKRCLCGCGETIKSRRVFVDKEHQLAWMVAGGASQLNALQPLEAKSRGGHTTGSAAARSGRLLDASRKGAEKSKAIAQSFREKQSRK